jgi:hypothetical protein
MSIIAAMRRGVPKRYIAYVGLLIAVVGYIYLIPMGHIARFRPQKTVEDRLNEYGPAARERMKPWFESAGVSYPPAAMTILALKADRRVEIWAGTPEGQPRKIHTYRVYAASGQAGPKLADGDRQVPEGIYAIESLNPNSRFHLSLRVNYPNDFDRAQARSDGRYNLGSDIMIHGGSASIGCIAIGDEAIEELFTLASDTQLANIRVLIAPCDLRVLAAPASPDLPPWVPTLYKSLEKEMLLLRGAPPDTTRPAQ